MSKAFEWLYLTNGRGRFCGLTRGWDDRPHEVFAVEFDGQTFYGELRDTYAGNAISIEVISFGYASESAVAIPGAQKTLSPHAAESVKADISKLVSLVSGYHDNDDKPAALRMPPGAYFTGHVAYADGWINLSPFGSADSQ
jgi:hypothetical protein